MAAATTPARTPPEPAEQTWRSSLVVTFSFRCNLACTFCMVEDVLDDRFRGVSLADFERLCAEPTEQLRAATRIVLSGGEVTVSKQLPAYAKLARALPWVEHVRIQTNATRLGDEAYLRSLLDAGVDEFFVSIHGHDAATCDAITQRKGSFDEIVAGMRAVAAAGATLITNTALVAANVPHLPAIVDLVAPIGPKWLELWGYWPRVDDDVSRFLVPVGEMRPHVIAALRRAVELGVAPVLKWYPRCLLPDDLVRYHDDGQPGMLIEERFWDREPQYGCLYGGVCEDAKELCSGLSHAYVRALGWEQDLLLPRRAPRPHQANAAAEDFALRNLLTDAAPRRGDTAVVAAWLDGLGLAFGAEVAGWRLVAVARSRFRDRVKLSFARGEERIELVLRAAHEPGTRLAATPSFALAPLSATHGARREVASLADALATRMAAHDRGGRALP